MFSLSSLTIAAAIGFALGGQPVAAEAPALKVGIGRVSSGRKYELGRAAVGELPYIDRKYAFKQLPPALDGQLTVRTSMDDDYVDAAEHLTLTLSAPATIYVGIDRRGKGAPSWTKDWKLSAESLSVDDISSHIYSRRFPAGPVTLGGNERNKTGANNNYVVIIVPEKSVPDFAAADFAGKVLPLLSARCFGCHGPDQQEGGLRLDVRRRAMLGGDAGPAIHSGSAEQSELVARIVSPDVKLRMPLDDDPLTDAEIALLKRWIDAGAVWPDDYAGKEAASDHWSFRPIVRPPIPSAGGAWARTPIDAFVAQKHEAAGLTPSPEANRRTLIRRLFLDLTGLPPSPAEVQAFVDDKRPQAYDQLVNRLLESPHFGERWGKHWLDLARFAESDGYENDNPRPDAWRYRDWVLDAVSRDLPFDQFTIAQLAGDLLPDARPQDRIATGFHRNTLHNSAGGADQEEFRAKNVKDRTAVTGAVWLGLTLNCAECHTHKYDPISHREYYGFYALFNNADHGKEGEAPTIVAAERTTRIHKRGNFLDLGIEVEPGTPAFLPELKPRGPRADRLDLARWLVSPDHPLTARVAVNHVWQHLFGHGLVATPENFGKKGEPPSHPELLDWLAAEFAGLPSAQNPEQSSLTPWSRKTLIRLIVSSAAYRQSSDHPQAPPAVDPDNRLLWRQNRFRNEAETVRDVALAASGLLETSVGGPSIQPPLPKGLSQLSELKNERFQESKGSPHRRGLYVHMQRTFPYPMFATFDGPDGNQCIMLRDRSTTPLQALTLLNDPAFDECVKSLSKRLIDATQDELGRIHLGCELCLSRPPAEDELAVLRELLETQRGAGASEADLWQGVSRAILNLDETITRE